jgi:ankyrin repeat protein
MKLTQLLLCGALALGAGITFAQSVQTKKPSTASLNFYRALKSSNFELADQLLKEGADVNCVGCASNTTLFIDFLDGSGRSPRNWLLERNANPNLFSAEQGKSSFQFFVYRIFVPDTGWGWTPKESSFVDDIDRFAKAGAKMGLPDSRGNTVIHYLGSGAFWFSYQFSKTANQNFVFAMDTFLSNGVDINQPNRVGTTPLMLATRACDVPVTKYFLSKGANPDIKGKDGRQAWEHAYEFALSGNKACNEVVGLLKR